MRGRRLSAEREWVRKHRDVPIMRTKPNKRRWMPRNFGAEGSLVVWIALAVAVVIVVAIRLGGVL